MTMLRRLVPVELRERVARLLARRGRAATLPDPAGRCLVAIGVAGQRLEAADLGGPVWHPPIVVRGQPFLDAAEVERAAVRIQVDALTSALALRRDPLT